MLTDIINLFNSFDSSPFVVSFFIPNNANSFSFFPPFIMLKPHNIRIKYITSSLGPL